MLELQVMPRLLKDKRYIPGEAPAHFYNAATSFISN
jgi:hypothetical protein